ncbi:MAG: AMP-binding protein, partial [Myxococcota bacterium]
MNRPVGTEPQIALVSNDAPIVAPSREEKPLGMPLATPIGPREERSGLGLNLSAGLARAVSFLKGLRITGEAPNRAEAALEGALVLAVNERGKFNGMDAFATAGALWRSLRPVPAVPESARNGVPHGRLLDGINAHSVPASAPGADREIAALGDAIASDLRAGHNVLLFPQDTAVLEAVLDGRPNTPLLLASRTGKQIALRDVTTDYAAAPSDKRNEWLRDIAMLSTKTTEWPEAPKPSALVRPSKDWNTQISGGAGPAMPSEERNVVLAFLETLSKNPNRIFAVDEVLGEVTYGRMATLTYILTKAVDELPGDNIGVILGNSILDTALGYAIALSGKTATMPHPTWKERQIEPAAELAGIETIVTAQAVVRGLIDRKQQANQRDLAEGSKTAKEIASDRALTPFGTAEDALHPIEIELYGAPLGRMVSSQIGEALGRFGLSHVVRELKARGEKLDPDAAFLNLFTSGTTGTPKCVVKPHDSILPNMRELARALELAPDDVLCSAAPPFHIVGAMVKTIQSVMGLPEAKIPDPRKAQLTADTIEARKATLYVGTPTLIRMMLDKAKPGQLDSLRFIVTGAEPLTPQLEARIRELAPNAEIRQGYGATEMGVVTFETFDPKNPELRSLGSVLPGVDVRLVDSADPTKEVPEGE